jgi:hypothetical protein
MKTYRCHKVVQAAKIAKVVPSPDIQCCILQCEQDVENRIDFVTVDDEWYCKHKPQPGGYYVRYEDGYTSYSPAEAFEAGYSELEDPSRTPDQVAISKQYNALVTSWCTEHQRPMPYRKSVECYAIVAKLDDEERDKLLALDD